METNKRILWFAAIGILVLIILIFVVVWFHGEKKNMLAIQTFNECADNGYPIMESYPRQCKTPDGRSFTENIVPETIIASSTDLVSVFPPLPNSFVKSPLDIKVEAVGQWFFEASFPVHLLDSNGKELAVAPAQTGG